VAGNLKLSGRLQRFVGMPGIRRDCPGFQRLTRDKVEMVQLRFLPGNRPVCDTIREIFRFGPAYISPLNLAH
jgi:hypothetical protein